MSYLISESGQELLEDVRKFCDMEVRPKCKDYDISGEWPKDIYEKAIEMGYHTLDIPETYGGLDIGCIDKAALMEAMAEADAGFAVTLAASNLGLKPVMSAGSEEQKRSVCGLTLDGGFGAFCLTEPQAGSDAGGIRTKAVKDGDTYVLNGRKCFITNGSVASYYCVAAMTDSSRKTKGISMFLVDAKTPGVYAENHENKMGIRTSDTCDVVFEDCRIPVSSLIGREGQGFSLAMEALNQGRIWMGCIAVGIACRGMEEAVNYAASREQFGRPLTDKQAVRFKLADMALEIETARQMVAHALTRMDSGLSYAREAAMAKCYASDIAVKAALEAVQIFGGYGYSREYPVEKLLRDAKVFQIFEGTNEVLREVISRDVISKARV